MIKIKIIEIPQEHEEGTGQKIRYLTRDIVALVV
jgi:hypothetical protein